jgi:acyl-CoA synthetase (AMP-forming)/AMP-acid ligase II/thioesterase domain-containing protein
LDLTEDECRRYLTRLNASTLVYEAGIHSPAPEVARKLGMRLIRIRSSRHDPAGMLSLEEIETPAEEKPCRQTDAALLFHTSATTGIPKLVPRSRANLRAAAGQDARALQLNAADRFLSLMPLHYAHGISAVFSQLSCGGSVWCAPAFQADNFLATLERFRPTWFSASPTIQRIVVQLAQDSPEAFQNVPLRFVRSAGSAPAPDVIEMQQKLLGVPVLDGYGLTEAATVARNTLSQSKAGSVGRSTGTQVAIMDDSGELLPPETAGEIVLQGPTVLSGYLDDPEANQAAFRDGWFRTGDIGRLDRDGFLFIVGRRKEMINRGGKKIFPQEVDTVLAAHPAVAEVASFGVPHRTLGEEVASAVVLRSGKEVAELELRRFAAERLAGYKVPRRIVFAEKIPRTASGKPKRNALAEEFREQLTPAATRPIPAAESPLGDVERNIAEIWRRILCIDRVDVTDDFFDLGGDSLSTALMLAEIERTAHTDGRQLDLSNFFLTPTVASLARVIADVGNQRHGRILFLRKEGTRNPFFCFSHSELSSHQFHPLFRWLAPERPFLVVYPTPAMQDGRLPKVEDIARQSAASIRAAQPRGPYVLGGYCFGGVVAFETARQLLEEGSEVALVALFDTPTPGYPKVVREWRRYVKQSGVLLRALAQGKRLFTTADIVAHLRALAGIARRKLGARTTRSLSTAGLAKPPIGEGANTIARRAYLPGMLSAPIVHFMGADVPVSASMLSDPRFGWQDFALGGFEARMVPGDHVSILAEANAPALATELEKALAASDSAPQPTDLTRAAAAE